MNEAVPRLASKINSKMIIVVLLLGTFVAILNQTLLITALPQIMAEFEISANQAQWLTTAYMLTNGIVVPISAFLIAKFTARQLFFTAIIIFLTGTFLAGISGNFVMLLSARFIQAVGAGIIMPLVTNILLLITNKHNRGSAMGLLVLVICFAPAIGPTIAGAVVDAASWRYLFYGSFPLTLIVLIAAIFTLENVTQNNNKEKIDILSVIISTIAFGGILYGLSLAGSLGWGSRATIGWVFAGGASLAILVLRQLQMSQPMIEFRVMKYRTFSISAVLVSIVFGTLFGIETIVPLYAQNVEGASALLSGLMLLPGAALMGILSPLVGRYVDKIGIKSFIVIGFVVITVSTIPLSIVGTQKSLELIVILYTLRMVGIGLLMTPLQTGAMNSIPRHLYRHGVAVYSTLTSISGSVGISIFVSFYTNMAKNSQGLNGLGPENIAFGGTFLIITLISALATLLSFKLKKDSVTGTEEESAISLTAEL
jgi:EmrB/QacA subfamily drug resistance transporter